MIKFRTMSVAASTVNRILNVADELERRAAPAASPPAAAGPSPPEPSAEGARLDAALGAAAPPVDGAPELAGAVIADGLGL